MIKINPCYYSSVNISLVDGAEVNKSKQSGTSFNCWCIHWFSTQRFVEASILQTEAISSFELVQTAKAWWDSDSSWVNHAIITVNSTLVIFYFSSVINILDSNAKRILDNILDIFPAKSPGSSKDLKWTEKSLGTRLVLWRDMHDCKVFWDTTTRQFQQQITPRTFLLLSFYPILTRLVLDLPPGF